VIRPDIKITNNSAGAQGLAPLQNGNFFAEKHLIVRWIHRVIESKNRPRGIMAIAPAFAQGL
jgi:hypothetical protein